MKLSFKATTPLLWFNIVLFNCRNAYCAIVWIRQICSPLCHRCLPITQCHLKHQRFFKEPASRSSHPFPRRQKFYVRVWTHQIFLLLHHRCVSITICRLKHRRFFIESTLWSPTPFLVAWTTEQECELVRSAHYYITAACPLYFIVSSIDDSLHSRHCDPLTRAVILYGVSQTSYSQNLLVGFFNVDLDFFVFLRTWVLGLQVKLLYGSVLSIATSIFCHILVIFVYQFAVDDLCGCNRLSSLIGLLILI